MIVAVAVQIAAGCLWATIYGSEAVLFAWPWFLAWASGVSLAGFLACRRGARGQSATHRALLGLVGPVSFVVASTAAFSASFHPISLIAMAAIASYLLLPSWLGCLLAPKRGG